MYYLQAIHFMIGKFPNATLIRIILIRTGQILIETVPNKFAG